MTIYDDTIFAAGGGSTVKIYTPGLLVKAYEQVRSRYDGQVYVRMSEAPTNLAVSVDPAFDLVNFTSDNQIDTIGSVREFVDIGGNSTIEMNGKIWLKSNRIITDDATVKALTDQNKFINKKIGHSATLYPASVTGLPKSTTPSGTWFKQFASDGNGNWLTYTTTKMLYRSSDDGITWTFIATLTLAESMFAANTTGTWWRADSDGNVYHSFDFGTTWTPIQRPVAAAGNVTVTVFKFMEGKLYWASNALTPKAAVDTTPVSYGYVLPDTTDWTQPWSALTYPGDAAVAAGLGSAVTGFTKDILVTDGYIAFVCSHSGNVRFLFGIYDPNSGITKIEYSVININTNTFGNLIYDGYKFYFHSYYTDGNTTNTHSLSTFTKSGFVSTLSWGSASTVHGMYFKSAYDSRTTGITAENNYFYKFGSYIQTGVGFPMVKNGEWDFPKTAKINIKSTEFGTIKKHAMGGDTILAVNGDGGVIRYRPYVGLITDDIYLNTGTAKYLRIA